MQKQESGSSDLEFAASNVTGADSVSRKHRRSLIALALIAACSLSLASAQETNKGKPEPLMIQEQGSFAIGGSCIIPPRTFSPPHHGAFYPPPTPPPRRNLLGGHPSSSSPPSAQSTKTPPPLCPPPP